MLRAALLAAPRTALAARAAVPVASAAFSAVPGMPTLPEDLRPFKNPVTGRWRAPRLSARAAAHLRKTALILADAGVDTAIDAAGHTRWDPAWDRAHKATVMKPPKGHAYDKRKAERVDKIKAALAQQEKKVAEYKKTLPPKGQSAGLLIHIKKSAWEKE